MDCACNERGAREVVKSPVSLVSVFLHLSLSLPFRSCGALGDSFEARKWPLKEAMATPRHTR